jgi:hypothetical protein
LIKHRAVLGVQRDLRILGAPRPEPYVLELSPHDVAGLATRAEEEVATAHLNNEPPWGGRLFAVPESSCIDVAHAKEAFRIGRAELAKDPEAAASSLASAGGL